MNGAKAIQGLALSELMSIRGDLQGLNGQNNLFDLIHGVSSGIMFVVSILAVIGIIIGGIYMVTSNGDPTRAAKGRKVLVGCVIGLVISLCAGSLVNFVLNVLAKK